MEHTDHFPEMSRHRILENHPDKDMVHDYPLN